MRMPGFRLHKTAPAASNAAVRQVADEVFGREQGARVAEEWDNPDATCPYVWTFDRLERPIGTGRIGCVATHAISFYSRHGFVIHGAEFMEANIRHRQVTCRLQ